VRKLMPVASFPRKWLRQKRRSPCEHLMIPSHVSNVNIDVWSDITKCKNRGKYID